MYCTTPERFVNIYCKECTAPELFVNIYGEQCTRWIENWCKIWHQSCQHYSNHHSSETDLNSDYFNPTYSKIFKIKERFREKCKCGGGIQKNWTENDFKKNND